MDFFADWFSSNRSIFYLEASRYRYYESVDRDAFFLEANIISPFKSQGQQESRSPDITIGCCGICCNPRTRLTGLQCGHRFCYSCWDEYLTNKVKFLTCFMPVLSQRIFKRLDKSRDCS